MAFLSQFVGRPVFDREHHKVGTLEDVCVPAHQAPYPQIAAVKVGERWVPWSQMETLEGEARLRVSAGDIRDYSLKPHDVRLRDEILDHQVVDIEGRKVRRVNDLAITPTRTDLSWTPIGLMPGGIVIGLSKPSTRTCPTIVSSPCKLLATTWNPAIRRQ